MKTPPLLPSPPPFSSQNGKSENLHRTIMDGPFFFPPFSPPPPPPVPRREDPFEVYRTVKRVKIASLFSPPFFFLTQRPKVCGKEGKKDIKNGGVIKLKGNFPLFPPLFLPFPPSFTYVTDMEDDIDVLEEVSFFSPFFFFFFPPPPFSTKTKVRSPQYKPQIELLPLPPPFFFSSLPPPSLQSRGHICLFFFFFPPSPHLRITPRVNPPFSPPRSEKKDEMLFSPSLFFTSLFPFLPNLHEFNRKCKVGKIVKKLKITNSFSFPHLLPLFPPPF